MGKSENQTQLIVARRNEGGLSPVGSRDFIREVGTLDMYIKIGLVLN